MVATGNRTARSGVSIVEVITAVAVLGIAIPPIVAMFTEVSQRSPDDLYQNAAIHAANSLMEEIVSKSFEDPEGVPGSFGTEEILRRNFDDIDDFDGYTDAPAASGPGEVVAEVAEDVLGSAGDSELGSVAVNAANAASDAAILINGDSSAYGGIVLTSWVHNVSAASTDPTTPEADGSTDYKRITVNATWTVGGGGEVQFKTLRTKLPRVVRDAGPLDEIGSAGSVQNSLLEMSLVLLSTSDSPLLIDTFQVEADRATPPMSSVLVNQNGGSTYYLWAGYEPTPTREVAPNQWSADERSVPPKGSMEAYIGFLLPPAPGPITFTVTFNFSDGTSSVLVMPMEWS